MRVEPCVVRTTDAAAAATRTDWAVRSIPKSPTGSPYKACSRTIQKVAAIRRSAMTCAVMLDGRSFRVTGSKRSVARSCTRNSSDASRPGASDDSTTEDAKSTTRPFGLSGCVTRPSSDTPLAGTPNVRSANGSMRSSVAATALRRRMSQLVSHLSMIADHAKGLAVSQLDVGWIDRGPPDLGRKVATNAGLMFTCVPVTLSWNCTIM